MKYQQVQYFIQFLEILNCVALVLQPEKFQRTLNKFSNKSPRNYVIKYYATLNLRQLNDNVCSTVVTPHNFTCLWIFQREGYDDTLAKGLKANKYDLNAA